MMRETMNLVPGAAPTGDAPFPLLQLLERLQNAAKPATKPRTERMPLDEDVAMGDDLAETREYAIGIAMKRYLAEGKTPEEARKIVQEAWDAPWPQVQLPTFDEL